MNDQEAFEKYVAENNVNKRQIWNELTLDEIWQAACEHKQKEIDKYKILFEEEHYFRVEEFNKYKKLKECLEFVVKESGTSTNYNKKCREVLKELDGK